MPLNQRLQRRLIHAGGLDERRVGLDNDIALFQPRGNILPRAPRVDLILPDGNLAAAAVLNVLLQLVEMVDTEVGDANRADFAGFLLRLDERAPSAEAAFFSAKRRVQEEPGDLVAALPLME